MKKLGGIVSGFGFSALFVSKNVQTVLSLRLRLFRILLSLPFVELRSLVEVFPYGCFVCVLIWGCMGCELV